MVHQILRGALDLCGLRSKIAVVVNPGGHDDGPSTGPEDAHLEVDQCRRIGGPAGDKKDRTLSVLNHYVRFFIGPEPNRG